MTKYKLEKIKPGHYKVRAREGARVYGYVWEHPPGAEKWHRTSRPGEETVTPAYTTRTAAVKALTE